jgi:hypothetical protein
MKLIRGLIANKISSVRQLIVERVRLEVDERVGLTYVQICIDLGDFQKCILVGDAVREQIRDQFSVRPVEV